MTLNDLEWSFHIKLVLVLAVLDSKPSDLGGGEKNDSEFLMI